MLTAPHRRYLDETVEALRLELIAARSSGAAPVLVEGGERLDVDAFGASYRFALLFDSALPEGVPVHLEVARRRWEAEVLQREGLVVLLLVKRGGDGELPDRVVPAALLHAEPWYLLEMLAAAVEQVRDVQSATRPTNLLLDRLAGSVPPESSIDVRATSGSNQEQAEAIARCVTEPVWFVWGPPGTGKTTTLGHVVQRGAAAGQSILVAAHSNVAVDAAVLAAVEAGVTDRPGRVVRAGPAVLPEARSVGLSTRELAFAAHPALRRRWERITEAFASSNRPLAALIDQWRELMAELREIEDEILRGAQVVFATLSKAVAHEAINARTFDTAIVDEVSMSYPAQVVVTAARTRSHLHVFGDCRQLPPIVQSEDERVRERLGRDVFTACRADQPGAPGVTMLKEQYRMHPSIRRVVSDFAYAGQLRDADGLEARRAPVAAAAPAPGRAVVWCEIGHLGATRFFDRTRGSRFNPVSALVSVRLALDARKHAEHVVVLTPYRTQARLIAALVGDAELESVEVGTIHRYQGSEAPVVIVDLVDTSGRAVGTPFRDSAGERLLTVGLSRAQGKLLVVGARTMPSEGLSRRSLEALRSIRQGDAQVITAPWIGRSSDGFELSMTPAKDAPPVESGEVVAAWLPDDVPGSLRGLAGAHAEPWQPGHPTWLTRGSSFGLHAGSARFSASNARRFAEAFSDAVSGSPLTRRSRAAAAAGAAPAAASRHDACGRCGQSVLPDEATRYSLELRCTTCQNTRRASDREIGAWLRQVGPSCPGCRSAMRLISGYKAPHGPFLGCTTYPKCDSTLPLDALIDAAIHPDPPPVSQAKPPSRRSPTVKRAALDERRCGGCFLTKSIRLFDAGSDLCRDCQ